MRFKGLLLNVTKNVSVRIRKVNFQGENLGKEVLLRPIYIYSARSSSHGKIVYDFHDIKLPVATTDVGF